MFDIKKKIKENYYKYIAPLESLEKEINFIEKYMKTGGVKLTDYQKEFLYNINSYAAVEVKKCRIVGMSSVYAGHLSYDITRRKPTALVVG